MTTQTALSPTQTLILGTAAQRRTRLVLPLPDECRLVGGTRTRVLTVLVQRGLIEEIATTRTALAWRKNEAGQTLTLRVTKAGLDALEVVASRPLPAEANAQDRGPVNDALAPAKHPSNVAGGKLGLLLTTLAQDGGATIDTLTGLTGWLPHTTRAAMTRLRQRGHAIVLRKCGEQKTYQIAQPATAVAEAVDGPR